MITLADLKTKNVFYQTEVTVQNGSIEQRVNRHNTRQIKLRKMQQNEILCDNVRISRSYENLDDEIKCIETS